MPLWGALMLLTTATAAPVAAQTAKAERSATLTVWNRPIVVSRVTVKEARPTERAAAAARRVQVLPDDVRPEVRAHIDSSVDRSRALSDLHAEIQDPFNEFGVQIMSPTFESQPDGAVVVPRSRWFAAPAPPLDASRRGS